MAEDEDETQTVDMPSRPGDAIRRDLGIMTPTELASALGVHVGTLKQWRYRRVGPVFTMAEHRIYYRYEDVMAYFAKNVQEVPSG